MSAGPLPLTDDRAALIDKAADWLVSQPHPPSPLIPVLISEFEISVSEACAVARRAYETAFVRISKEALHGDMSKLPQLFADKEFREGMQSLITSPDSLKKYIDILNNAKVDGTVMRDLNKILGDTQTKIQQLSSSWTTMMQQMGSSASTYVVPVMDRITKFFNDQDSYSAGMSMLSDSTDPDLLDNQRNEFFKQLSDANLTKNLHQSFNGWEEAVRAVGRREIKSPMEWIQKESLRTDSRGVLRNNYGLYQRGRGPENLNAAPATGTLPMNPDAGTPWNGKVPIPGIRPTRLELAHIEAQNSGRENVAAIVKSAKGEKDLNDFYGTDKTPPEVRAHRVRMETRFPGRDKGTTYPEALADLSALTTTFESGSKTAADNLKDGGQQGGEAFLQAMREAAVMLTQAAAKAADAIRNAKPADGRQSVNANTGSTSTFVRSPNTGRQ